MEVFEYIGRILIVLMMTSTAVMMLFRAAFRRTDTLSKREKFLSLDSYNRELAKKEFPTEQFRKYWFFVLLQKYSFICLSVYMAVALIVWSVAT